MYSIFQSALNGASKFMNVVAQGTSYTVFGLTSSISAIILATVGRAAGSTTEYTPNLMAKLTYSDPIHCKNAYTTQPLTTIFQFENKILEGPVAPITLVLATNIAPVAISSIISGLLLTIYNTQDVKNCPDIAKFLLKGSMESFLQFGRFFKEMTAQERACFVSTIAMMFLSELAIDFTAKTTEVTPEAKQLRYFNFIAATSLLQTALLRVALRMEKKQKEYAMLPDMSDVERQPLYRRSVSATTESFSGTMAILSMAQTLAGGMKLSHVGLSCQGIFSSGASTLIGGANYFLSLALVGNISQALTGKCKDMRMERQIRKQGRQLR